MVWGIWVFARQKLHELCPDFERKKTCRRRKMARQFKYAERDQARPSPTTPSRRLAKYMLGPMHTRDFKLFGLVFSCQCMFWGFMCFAEQIFPRVLIEVPHWLAATVFCSFAFIAPLLGYFLVIYRLGVWQRISRLMRVVLSFLAAWLSAGVTGAGIVRSLETLDLFR